MGIKLVINRCFGGYGLSKEAEEMLTRKGKKYVADIRDSLELIQCVEELGDKANGSFAKLKIVEIPFESTDYLIDEYDGFESVVYVLNGKLYKI